MMRRIDAACLLAAGAALLFAGGAAPKPQPALKLERVVLLMRHSVRPPTKVEVTPPGWAAQPWSSWTTPVGELTPHGAAGARLMGQYDRAAYGARGLFGRGCPAPGVVAVWASGKTRAIETAKNYVDAAFPGCGVPVDHPADENNDPVFHPAEAGGLAIDETRALAAAKAQLPANGMAGVYARHANDFATMQRVLGCCRPPACAGASCSLTDLPSELVSTKGDGPDMSGALGVASTAGQTILLEYVEGKPMGQVGWGRASKADIVSMLNFHPTKFQYEARTPYVADRAAAPIARRILEALAGRDSRNKMTLLVGHDTNIAQLGGMLDLHWKIAEYPADDPPPGGALGFELLRGAKGERFVRAFYQAQTMDQLRALTPLTASAPPARTYIPITGCTRTAKEACPLPRFAAIVQGKLDHPTP
jgi:4-phytase / acid phosphatase